MSNIRYEDVPDLSVVPVVAYVPPPPVVAQTAPAPTVAQTIPQPGTPLVDTAPNVFVSAPPVVTQTVTPPVIVPTAPPSTQGQPIPQPGRPLVELDTGNVILAPTVTAPTVAETAPLLVPLASVPVVAPEETSPGVSRQAEPIPQPGRPLVDTAPGVFIPAPVVVSVEAGPSAQTPSFEDETGLPDLEGLDVFGNPPLSGAAFVQYVRRGCDARNLDDLAVFANAMAEGLGGGMGDNGTSFGPWNMHQGGKLPAKYSSYPAFSPLVQTWAWTGSGIDWALNLMAKEGIGGLRGHAAVHAIVERFEIPANIGGQEVIRDDYYDQLAKMGDPYSFLAARAAGPNVTIPSSSGTTGATAKSPVGAVGFWRTLMDVFWKEVPKTRERVLAQGDNMKEVFK